MDADRGSRIADRGSCNCQFETAKQGSVRVNTTAPLERLAFFQAVYTSTAINFCSILKTNFNFPLEQKTETITRSAAFAPLTFFFLLLLSLLDAMGPVCLFAGERSPEAQPGAGAAHTGPGATRRDHQGRGHRGGRRRVGQPHPDALHRGGRVGDRRGFCGCCFLWLLHVCFVRFLWLLHPWKYLNSLHVRSNCSVIPTLYRKRLASLFLCCFVVVVG